MKLYTKQVNNCQECPYFCDEGEFCKHPSRIMQLHVVAQWWTVPGDCPLPEVKEG
jgi:hypothetical protein